MRQIVANLLPPFVAFCRSFPQHFFGVTNRKGMVSIQKITFMMVYFNVVLWLA